MTASTPTENGESQPTPVAPEQSDPTNGDNLKADVSINDAQTGNSDQPSENEIVPSSAPPVVSGSKRSRPPYKYDPNKITLRFLFANRDGLTVTVECNPTDTVGEVKGALLSSWPEGKNLPVSVYCCKIGSVISPGQSTELTSEAAP